MDKALNGRAAAERFVDLLTHGLNGSLCWRLIHDSDGAADGINFSHQLERLHDDFEERQADGYGVFAVVNGGGHRDAHISDVRAVFVDADDVPLPETWHLEPHFMVRRSATFWHAYWLVDGLDNEQFTEVQKRLAVHYGTDRAVSNPSRVMRVPGFMHLKNPKKPQAVTLTDMVSADLPGDMQYHHNYKEVTAGLPDVPDYVSFSRKSDPLRDKPLCDLDLPHNIEQAERFLFRREPAIANGTGNKWTYETACFVRDIGVSEPLCNEVMLHSEWNTERCAPAWPADELADVITNAYRYGENRAGSKRAPLSQLRKMADVIPLYPEQYPEWQKQQRQEHEVARGLAHDGADIPTDIPDDGNANDRDDPERHLFSVRDFLKRGKRRKFVIPSWLPANGFTGLLSPRGTGKSAVMTDLAARVATGLDWQDLPIDPDYAVAVYLCGEDDDGLEMNLTAWVKEYGQTIPADRMLVSDKIMQLKNDGEVTRWLAEIKNFVGKRKAVVFLDTWQRATISTKGQSADDEMARCVENAERLLAELNSPGIIAFHPPKAVKEKEGLTVMGSSVIENMTVAIWTLWQEADGLRLDLPRIRGAATGAYRKFKLKVVELDTTDQFDKPEKGVVTVKFAGTEDDRSKLVEQEETQRLAWGQMVRYLMEWEQEKPDGIPGSIPREQLAKMAAEQMANMGSRLYREWEPMAKTAGLESFSLATIRRELVRQFYPDRGRHRVVDFDDGRRLTVKGTREKWQFRLIDGPRRVRAPEVAE